MHSQIFAFVLVFSAGLAVIVHIMYLLGVRFQVLVLVAVVVILLSEYRVRDQSNRKITYQWFAATLALLVVAFGFSLVDGKRLWCDVSAHGWFSQGHALWHWISAMAMFTFYLHYAQPALLPVSTLR